MLDPTGSSIRRTTVLPSTVSLHDVQNGTPSPRCLRVYVGGMRVKHSEYHSRWLAQLRCLPSSAEGATRRPASTRPPLMTRLVRGLLQARRLARPPDRQRQQRQDEEHA